MFPFMNKYIDCEYLNKTRKIHILKNKVLLSELEYKLKRILAFEKIKTLPIKRQMHHGANSG